MKRRTDMAKLFGEILQLLSVERASNSSLNKMQMSFLQLFKLFPYT
jgi:hypothetical protein